jgi:hypothetical protein
MVYDFHAGSGISLKGAVTVRRCGRLQAPTNAIAGHANRLRKLAPRRKLESIVSDVAIFHGTVWEMLARYPRAGEHGLEFHPGPHQLPVDGFYGLGFCRRWPRPA